MVAARRRILIALAAGICASGAAAHEPRRPNIVLLVADDMRWDAMSCAGNPLLRTPNLDRLAREGMRFTNAFVTSPICVTSRASILTGQCARRHGVHDFRTPLPDPAGTYPVLLREAGYVTGFIGKWGVNPADRADLDAWALRFDSWAGDMNQTLYWHNRTCAWLCADGWNERTASRCDCGDAARRSAGVQGRGPHPTLVDPVHAETGFVPAQIRGFLDGRDPSKPFCLSVSLKAPHGPLGGYAPRFASDFEGRPVPRGPAVAEADASRQAPFLRAALGADRGLAYACGTELDGPRDQAFRQYYRLVEGVDSCVGELLHELDVRGLAGDTVIAFTSDNGQFTGEHGFAGKWLLHEESIRVPLILVDPRLPAGARGTTCDELVLTIDLHPSLLGLAGLAAAPDVHGRSLLPLLEQPRRGLRDGFFLEQLSREGSERDGWTVPCEGYRTRDAKYIVYVGQPAPHPEALYDLTADPHEMRDLIGDPAARPLLDRLRAAHRRAAADLR